MNFIRLFALHEMDFHSFVALLFRFALNSVTLAIIIRFIYYPITKRKDFLFAFFLLGTIIFLFCYLLANVQLQLGFVLGVFVIFRIIRFRTDAISIKEMTYLSIIIGTSVINALFMDPAKIFELIFTNIAIIVILFLFEHRWVRNQEISKVILYEKIDLIKPENHPLLLEDLKKRTGIEIVRFEIGKIDFLHDTTQIKIYFIESEPFKHYITVDDQQKNEDDD